jgi:hypothetical protein
MKKSQVLYIMSSALSIYGGVRKTHVTKAALQTMLFTLLGYNGQLIVCDFIKMISINLYLNSLDDNCL